MTGAIAPERLAPIAARFGTPFYVYDGAALRARAGELHGAFGGALELRYAVKANPNRAILELLRGSVADLDVSSQGEIERALATGWSGTHLGFTGPGKRRTELVAALDAGVAEIVLESAAEAATVAALVRERGGPRQGVLVRITPARLPRGFGVRMAGRPTPFGVDEEDLDGALDAILEHEELRVLGFHVYGGTQCLEEASIAESWAAAGDLFRRAAERVRAPAERLVIGAGIGTAHHAGERAPDLAALARLAAPTLERLATEPATREATRTLELGRALVAEAGVYVVSVIATKRSRGAAIAITDGGMHHHLAAAGHLGAVLHRNWRIAKLPGGSPDGPIEPWEVTGPLCTALDTLGRAVPLPGLAPGDLVAVAASGAYGPTASPLRFLSHPPPRELLVEEDGEVRDVSELPPS